MLITKFNRMISSRLLWGVFAVIISVSFVWTFSSGDSGCEDSSSGNAVGRLYGKPVPPDRFSAARFYALRMRNESPTSAEEEATIRDRAWKRLAALETAKKLGLSTTDAELADALRQEQAFAANGVFNRDRYHSVVRSQLQVEPQTFEEFLRQELTLSKLLDTLQCAVWTSPFEMQQRLSSLTDSFLVQYASLPVSAMGREKSVSRDEVERFFNDNSALFELPEMVSVEYVTFPIAPHAARAQVSEEDIGRYYDDNTADFSVPGASNDFITLPLDEVRPAIMDVLKHRQGVLDARDEATKFVVSLTPDRQGKAPSFREAAARDGLAIQTSAYISLTGKAPDLPVDTAFNRAAFALDPIDPERNFSDAVVGEKAVYVLAYRDKKDRRVPAFAEVAERVLPMAREEARKEAFQEYGRKVKNAVAKSLKAGKTFEFALKDQKLQVSTSLTFTVYDSTPETVPHFDVLIPRIMTLSKGELTDAIDVDGGAILAYVADRQPGNPSTMEAPRAELLRTVNRYRVRLLFQDWQAAMLTDAGFQDLTPPIPLSKEEDEEDTEAPSRNDPAAPPTER